MVLEYAEKGNLQEGLKEFKEAGVCLGVAIIQQVLSQVSMFSTWLYVLLYSCNNVRWHQRCAISMKT